jgi:uncharacterized protein (UPF0147 family)
VGCRMTNEEEYMMEVEKAFKNAAILLNGMITDRAVPRNIKRMAQRGLNELERKDETPAVIASNIMSLIDDISLDPNIPFHTRTTIYRILSVLERVKDK